LSLGYLPLVTSDEIRTTRNAVPREMLCYCLNFTYDDVRCLWKEGYFKRSSTHNPGLYCTSCKGDLAWFLEKLNRENGEVTRGDGGKG